MATSRLTAIDIFNSLTPSEKRKALSILRKSEQTPCEKLGHKYKAHRIEVSWFHSEMRLICERCGDTIKR
jgi:hypothetical protein